MGVVDDSHVVISKEREGDVNQGHIAGLLEVQVLGGEEERDHLAVECSGVREHVCDYSSTVAP